MAESHLTDDSRESTELPPSSWLPSACVVLLCCALLIWHARSFLPFISDDAFISLRYAERLLAGHGLTWTEGPRVEGYTNLLWVLACAVLGWAGVDLIDAARAWGFVGMAGVLAAFAYAYRPRGLGKSLPLLVSGLAFALSAPIAVWTIGGMEQPFVAALLAWAAVLSSPLVDKPAPSWRDAIAPSLFLGLLCLTRSDGGVVCIGLAAGLLAARGLSRTSFKLIAGLALFPIILGGGQLAFRLFYYGDWLPNPAHVKVAFTAARIREGLRYVGDAMPYLGSLLVPAIAAALIGLVATRLPRRTTFLAMQLVTWTAYLVLVGGDIFPAHRHWVPSIVISALLVGEFAAWLIHRGKLERIASWIATPAMLGMIVVTQSNDPEVQRVAEERWEWDGQIVGEFLRKAFGAADPLIACDPAGCIPYFTKFRAIDMMGLNDFHIARHKGSEFGKGVLGHELGDGKYVLDRKPDLVLWNRPTGSLHPMFPSGKEMAADPRFGQFYRLIFLAATAPRPCGIWMRVDSDRIGVRAQADRVILPTVLAATSPATPATLDDQGRLGVLARSGTPATTVSMGVPLGLGVPPGLWRVVAESDVPVRIRIRQLDHPERIVEGVGKVMLDAGEGGAAIDLDFEPAAAPSVHVRQISIFPQRR